MFAAIEGDEIIVDILVACVSSVESEVYICGCLTSAPLCVCICVRVLGC